MRRECRERFPRHRWLAIPTCITARAWRMCIPGSLTSGFLWSRWWEKRSRHSWRTRNPQFYVSGKRPMPYFMLSPVFPWASEMSPLRSAWVARGTYWVWTVAPTRATVDWWKPCEVVVFYPEVRAGQDLRIKYKIRLHWFIVCFHTRKLDHPPSLMPYMLNLCQET